MPRPSTPTNDNCYESEAMRRYGWMVGRMYDMDKIVRDLELAGIRHSDSYDAIFRRRVVALDLAHGLYPFRDAPTWRNMRRGG